MSEIMICDICECKLSIIDNYYTIKQSYYSIFYKKIHLCSKCFEQMKMYIKQKTQ